MSRKLTNRPIIDRVFLRQYIDNYLHVNHVTRKDFAESLGFAYTYFSEVLRDREPKGITSKRYCIICNALNVPEETFIIQDTPKVKKPGKYTKHKQPKKAVIQAGTSISAPNVEMSADQFNMLIQAINNLGDAIAKGFNNLSATQSATTIIQGKIYSEMSNISEALGTAHNAQTETVSSVTIKPQYVNHFGGTK